MILDSVPLVSTLKTKLAWLTQRQDVLSRNVANASTPGFMPQDLAEPDFSAALAEASRGGFLVTNAKHLRGRSSVGGSFHAVDRPDSQASPDGNRVALEEQMMRVAETQMQFAEATGIYKKMFSLWRTALGAPHA